MHRIATAATFWSSARPDRLGDPSLSANSVFLARHADIEDEVWQAFLDGYAAALREVAARHVEVDDAWRPVGRRTHEERVAERIALFEACAAQMAVQLYGRPTQDEEVSTR